jgi:hypothetical protein
MRHVPGRSLAHVFLFFFRNSFVFQGHALKKRYLYFLTSKEEKGYGDESRIGGRG